MVQHLRLSHGDVFLGSGGPSGLSWDHNLNGLNNALAREGGEQYKTTGTIKFKFQPAKRSGELAAVQNASNAAVQAFNAANTPAVNATLEAAARAVADIPMTPSRRRRSAAVWFPGDWAEGRGRGSV